MAETHRINPTGSVPALVQCSSLAMLESHAAKVLALFNWEGTIFCFTTKPGKGVGVNCNILSLVVQGYYINRNSNGERDNILRSNNIRQ